MLDDIARFMQNNSAVSVCWLYGSRARGNHSEASDYDLAVAFEYSDHINSAPLAESRDVLLRRHLLDSLLDKSPAIEVSIVDINSAPVPLAYAIILDGIVLCVKNSLRLCSEAQRIWSLWERYKYEFELHRSEQ